MSGAGGGRASSGGRPTRDGISSWLFYPPQIDTSFTFPLRRSTRHDTYVSSTRRLGCVFHCLVALRKCVVGDSAQVRVFGDSAGCYKGIFIRNPQ